MSVGERISKLRKEMKISQNQLAKALEISRQAVSKWETDQSTPDTLNLIRLADVLETDVEYLASGRKSPAPLSPSVLTVERIVERPIEVEKIVEVIREVPVEKVIEVTVEKPVVRKVIRTKYIRNPIEYVQILLLGIVLGFLVGFLLT